MKAYEPINTLSKNLTPQPSWLEKQLLKKLQPLLDKPYGTLEITLPSGYECRLGSNSPIADVKLHNFRPLLRLYMGGINGWSESYLAKEWDSNDLTALVKWALTYEKELGSISKASFLTQTLHNIYHWQRDNSRKGSQRNIAAHYDLGNDFYKHWLDKSMTYSAALYQNDSEPLIQAQRNKNQRILELLDAKPEERIVEIGCGWGGFAIQASQENNLNVHGITLSKEQFAWAKDSVKQAQLDERIHLSLTDYRDLTHQYDGVVSIEMFEAVGEAHWDTYFQTLKRVLKPGGNAVLQVISIEDERYHSYRKQADFIQRYVFPGGMLPSVEVLQEKISEHGFKLKQMQLFGKDYARTLREWAQAFEDNWQHIRNLNGGNSYDDNFYRLWRYYLAYCEGGFEEGSIDVGLYVLCHED